MRIFRLLCALLFSTAFSAKATGANELVDKLTQVLAHKPAYVKQRTDRIAVLTKQFNAHRAADEQKYELGLRIYQEYKSFKYDSAFAYAQRLVLLATKLNSPAKVEASKLNLAFIQVSSGMFKEAFESLASIRPAQLDSAGRAALYFTQARAYSDLVDFNSSEYYRPAYIAKAVAYSDTALAYCRPGSYQWLTVQGFRYLKRNNIKASAQVYQRILSLPQLTLPQLAVNASTAAYVAELSGQPAEAFRLLTQAAIADVESATTETLALYKLAALCYQQGDLRHAYLFIQNARQDAAFYNARLRQVQISSIFSVIEGERISIIEQQRKTLSVYAVATTVLALLVIAFAAVIWRQLRRLQRAEGTISAINQTLRASNANLNQLNQQLSAANDKLHEANLIKEEYIGYYFNITSEYIDRLEDYKNALANSLANKQYANAQHLVDSLNIKRERHDLFRGFDGVFLKLFPHFVADFNELLKPEERIRLADDQLLTAELRLFALIRLGIDDSERISKILGYTINTVYTYKARTKKKSRYPGEEFENRVRAIQAV